MGDMADAITDQWGHPDADDDGPDTCVECGVDLLEEWAMVCPECRAAEKGDEDA